MKRLFIFLILMPLTIGGVSCSSNPRVSSSGDIDMPEVYSEILVGMSLSEVTERLDLSEVEYLIYPDNPVIRGIFRDVSGTDSLVSTSIKFELFFDSKQQFLIKKQTRNVFTGM